MNSRDPSVALPGAAEVGINQRGDLHGNGRGTAPTAFCHSIARRPRHGAPIDAIMLPEAPIFGGHQSADKIGADCAELQPVEPALIGIGAATGEFAALPVEQHGFAARLRHQRRELWHRRRLRAPQ